MRIVSLWICTVSFSYNLFIFYLQPTSAYFLLLILYSIHRAICRPSDHSVGKPPALGRDSNPGRADLLVGTLTIRPPHLPVFLVIRFLPELSQQRKKPLFASYWKNLGRVPYISPPPCECDIWAGWVISPLMLDWLAKEFKCCITEMLEEGFSLRPPLPPGGLKGIL